MASETIYKGRYSECRLINMKAEQYLKPHSADVDIMIVIKDGSAEIDIGGKKNYLQKGEYILCEANLVHAVKACNELQFYLFKLAPHE